jgi:hypothetical protein
MSSLDPLLGDIANDAEVTQLGAIGYGAEVRDGNGYKPAGFYRPKPVPVKNIYAH